MLFSVDGHNDLCYNFSPGNIIGSGRHMQNNNMVNCKGNCEI
jgi:hypothetical protein